MGLLSDMSRSGHQRVSEAKERVPEAALRAAILASPTPPPLRLARRGFDLIAELKLRSPSLGNLSAATVDPVKRLEAYAEGGAALCSILTEPTRFDGDLEHLRLAVETLLPYGVPAMRKDFLVDPYQVLEARAYGASGVLLIVRMLPRATLSAMLDCAAEHGLFVLLEAFDGEDLAVARDLARERAGRTEQILMGLNCRDLETLQINFERFVELRAQLPDAWPCVAESGVAQPADAARVAALGYRLALVGTSLMQRADAAHAVHELIVAGRKAAA
ncbi:MAG TPA: indole-3-glycerol phosphate synthase TrpC [Burkholderiaceae bacterium]